MMMMSGLVRVQPVCKRYQQTTLVCKELLRHVFLNISEIGDMFCTQTLSVGTRSDNTIPLLLSLSYSLEVFL